LLFRNFLDADYEELVQDWKLKKTKVYLKDKRWEIIIEATNYIDAPTLSKIEGLIKDKIGCIDDLIIIIKYAKSPEWFYNYFDKVWADIVYSIGRDISDCALSSLKTVSFKVLSPSSFSTFLKCSIPFS
jgi:hypothetical protein